MITNKRADTYCYTTVPIVIVLMVFVWPLFARDKTDVIIISNGDRMTCEIKKLDRDVLYVGLDYVDGLMPVQWSKVVNVESSQLFLVNIQDGSQYLGRLSFAKGSPNRTIKIMQVVMPQNEVEIAQSQIVKITETSDDFWQRFNGQIKTGIVFSKGNLTTQYDIGSEIEYPRQHWVAQATANFSLSANKGSNPSSRNQLEFSGLRFMRVDKLYYSGFSSFLQSSVQQISLQSTIGAGIGYYLANSSHLSMSVLGGVAWQNTKYNQAESGISAPNLAAGVIATEVKVFRFNKTNLRVRAALFPALSETHRLRLNVNSTYSVKLIGNLSWDISFYGNWDTKPPPRFASSDYGSSSGFSWTFGNR